MRKRKNCKQIITVWMIFCDSTATHMRTHSNVNTNHSHNQKKLLQYFAGDEMDGLVYDE